MHPKRTVPRMRGQHTEGAGRRTGSEKKKKEAKVRKNLTASTFPPTNVVFLSRRLYTPITYSTTILTYWRSRGLRTRLHQKEKEQTRETETPFPLMTTPLDPRPVVRSQRILV
jgi:hypothetical protein